MAIDTITFYLHSAANLLTDEFEGHHALHSGAYRLHVVEEHKQEGEGADETHQAEHLFDGHHEYLRIVRMDAMAESIGCLVAESVTVESGADALAYAVADEAADGEGHEERGELDEVLQIDGHRREEDAVAEGAQERRQP